MHSSILPDTPRRQSHWHFVTTLAHDPTKPEVGSDITYIQCRYFRATKPSIGHEGEDGALPETTLVQ